MGLTGLFLTFFGVVMLTTVVLGLAYGWIEQDVQSYRRRKAEKLRLDRKRTADCRRFCENCRQIEEWRNSSENV